jgi:hypothetical protein
MRNNIDLKRDSESAVRTAGVNEFQQSSGLLKNDEQNFVGLSQVGRGVLEEKDGI